MKTKLSIKERVLLTTMLPERASLEEQILSKEIFNKITLSEEEKKRVNWKVEKDAAGGGRFLFDPETKIEKEIDFPEAELNFMRDRFAEISKKKEITMDAVEIILKIKNIK